MREYLSANCSWESDEEDPQPPLVGSPDEVTIENHWRPGSNHKGAHTWGSPPDSCGTVGGEPRSMHSSQQGLMP